MGFKARRARKIESEAGAEEAPAFRHASGYTDLAGVLGEHTLDAEQEAAATAPKGYRARSVSKVETTRRR
jgi:hypothetical protein